MTTAELIRERLAPLAPDAIEVFDESHEHAGHAGAKDGGWHGQAQRRHAGPCKGAPFIAQRWVGAR